ncbi:unnamed protein product [Didymodactylos carnosus]|uniref:Solute-binding protein family 3/N-terminal domain-containing protein n=1 Tax=Didymodactylos carnosus TaxID=1234261 RepID=A0A815VN58_9BILA|nr:unnamed protein product [Didymodactylos carnosus]CAF4391981.1 unnamed protein product [Didymodactylos carnosus]
MAKLYVSTIKFDDSPLVVITNNKSAPITGFSIDMMNKIGSILSLKIVYSLKSFEQLFSFVKKNKFHLSLSSITDTKQRQQQNGSFIDYFKFGSQLFARRNDTTNVKRLADLCGYSVTSLRGSTQQTDVETVSCPSNKKVKSVPVETNHETFEAVKSGQAQFGIQDEPLITYNLKHQYKGYLKEIGLPYNILPYGILCQKNSPLCCTIVQAVNYLIYDGTYSYLLNKWKVRRNNIGISLLNRQYSCACTYPSAYNLRT